jgi:hypothetical protein
VNSQNPTIIAYGEEGDLHAGTSLSVTGNTIINDLGYGVALWNAGDGTAIFGDNTLSGFGGGALVSGSVTDTGTTVPPVPTPFNVPEPASLALLGASLIGAFLRRSRARTRRSGRRREQT